MGSRGRLSAEAPKDAQDTVSENVAAIVAFRQALSDILKKKYPSSIVYRDLVMKSIEQNMVAQSFPEMLAYSREQLQVIFGENTALVQTALSEMKMRKK